MKERRGRPVENNEPILKYTQVFKSEDGSKEIWTYDKTKYPFGPISVEIKYPKQEFYAFVSCIDITDMTDSEFSELRKVCETSGVTVLEGQKLNDEQQIAFSERFGELEISIGTNAKKDLNPFIKPQISRISNVNIETNKMIPLDDHKVIFDRGNNVFHSDSSFKPIPA